MSDNYCGKSFSITYGGIARQLICDIVLEANGRAITVKGLWDTGATTTCISSDVIISLALHETGKQIVHTPSGESKVGQYMVNIGLPNGVMLENLIVCGSSIGEQGLGVLVGMDVIQEGDFCVSNYEGKTTMTFRIPSKQRTDYAKSQRALDIIGQRHGQGKRKRR